MIQSGEEKLRKGFTILFVAMLVAYCFFYLTRHEHFLSWNILSSVATDTFIAETFQKGLFNFELKGVRYTLEENFEGGEVVKSPLGNWTHVISWLGIAYLLSCLTYLKRFGFFIASALVILFLVSLDLGALELFGLAANSKIPLALMIFLGVGPGYLFHAFFKSTGFAVRLITFIVVVASVALLLQTQSDFSVIYFKANSTFGFSVITFLFVAFVAEEIIFLILFAVTQAKGKGNQRHFMLVSLIYLGFVLLYFLKKAGIYANTLAFLNPYFLLPVSAAVALWTLRYKQEFFEDSLSVSMDVRHFLIGLGLTGFGFLSTSFVDGNDSAYESFHYLITYAHLGLGGLFFLYIIMNFLDALIGGHAVYRIVYRERNFPYATSKLVGFIAIAAFFFMADKTPLRLVQGARYNYLGDYERLLKNDVVADRYYEKAGIFAYNNHYSNYQLGLIALREGNTDQAAYRFDRATQRYPTPQAYVNAAVYIKDNSLAKAISYLRTSELDFGEHGEINNNLANLLMTNGNVEEASELLASAPETGEWNMATEVNQWRLFATTGSKQSVDDQQYLQANQPVKANILSYILSQGLAHAIPFDTTDLQTGMNLHQLVLLNNAAYLGEQIDNKYFQAAISGTYNGEVQEDLKFAALFNRYLSGDINGAYLEARQLEFSISALRMAELKNLIGLLLLEQGVLDQALIYFQEAEELGSASGAFNAVVTMTEQEAWSVAKQKWSELIAEDQTLQPYYDQMQAVLEGSEEVSYNYLYYRWSDFEVEELVQHLQDLQIKPAFVESMWLKIERVLFSVQDSDSFQRYRDAFAPLLTAESKSRSAMAGAFLLDQEPTASTDPMNAFDEVRTINYVNHLAQTDTLAAYQAVIDASNIYEASLLYQVRYVELALDLGILSYAEEGLKELEGRLSDQRLRALSIRFEKRREELSEGF